MTPERARGEVPVAPTWARSLGTGLIVGFALACHGPGPGAEGAAPPDPGPRVRVLGTVQDGGLPHAACRCVRCRRAREEPPARRRIASLALVLPPGPRVYLIDATPDIREQLDQLHDLARARTEGVDRAPVDGVLLTHAHMGHYTGLAFFGFEAIHTTDMPVLCSPALARFLRANGPWSQLVDIGNIALDEISPGRPFDLGPVSVLAIDVPHRREYSDTLGFRLAGPRTTLLYIPDTDSWRAWDPPLTSRLEGVDVAILDGTFHSARELPGREHSSIGHPLMTDTMDLLEPRVRDGTLEVYFTHLNHSNPTLDPVSPEREELERRGFRVLGEGQEIPL